MPSISRTTIIGHLGSDPDVRFTPGGKEYARFTVATSKKIKDQEYTEWHKIVVWGFSTSQCSQLAKGDLVFVEGENQTRSWEKDGVKRYTTEINANLVCKMIWQRGETGHSETKANEQTDDDFPF